MTYSGAKIGPAILVLVGVVNEDPDFLGSNLGGAEAEDEEHRVDDVALAAAVRTNDGCEAFVEWTQDLFIKNPVQEPIL